MVLQPIFRLEPLVVIWSQRYSSATEEKNTKFRLVTHFLEKRNLWYAMEIFMLFVAAHILTYIKKICHSHTTKVLNHVKQD